MKYKLSSLKMIYPPLSNKEAIHMEEDGVQHIEETIKQSDFYMICGKPRGYFKNFEFDEVNYIINFELEIKNEIVDKGQLDLRNLECFDRIENEDIELKFEFGKDYMFIINASKKTTFNVIERFSPENILWYRSRNMKGILGLNNFKYLSNYELLYVGIAKKGDSYNRVIKQGHKTRMKILAKEPQRSKGVRVAEETFLMFFKVEPLIITTNGDIQDNINLKRIVADAEKAFVSLLKPKYNSIQFKRFPKGKDGLYDSDYDKYSYSINETIILNTPHGKIMGEYSEFGLSNYSDTIFIDGDNVELDFASK